MDISDTKNINDDNSSIIWVQYMDFLLEYAKHMKDTYIKKMKANSRITLSELELVNKQIHDKLDCLMTWDKDVMMTNT